jgi:4'-phosphopantetheinyl transferase
MMLQPVLIQLATREELSGRERVQRQRAAARDALARCAAICGAPVDGWEQDANRVPQPNHGFHWSISHKPLMVGAVIADHPVGIDIEHLLPRANTALWERLAEEQEWLIAGERSWDMFFRIWTAKEATLKANGRGIGSLGDCRVVAINDPSNVRLAFHGRQWQGQQYRIANHIAAVTVDQQQPHWHVVKETAT